MDGPQSPVVSSPPGAPSLGFGRDLRQAQRSFQAVLGRATTGASETREEQARDAARQFVSQTLVQPILKQVRDMDNTPPPFAPGPGEKQFRALMDAELAQRVTMSSHFPLIDRVARQLLKRGTQAPGVPAPAQQALNPLGAELAGAATGAIREAFTHPR